MTCALPLDNPQLAAEITRLAGHINAANYRFLQLIARFDKQSGWSGAGVRSCAHWLQWQCGIALGAAREKVRVARALQELPKICAAFGCGQLSYSMVRAITRKAEPATEDYYLYIARHATVSHMEKLVRQHDRAEKLQQANHEPSQYEARSANYYVDNDGCWVIKARLAPAEGELLVKALNSIAEQPQRGADPHETEPEQRSFGQKRADALSAMAEHYLATETQGPATLKGSERTQVMLHVDVSTLQQHSGQHNCRLGQNNWLHADTARRLSCDANLVTVLEDEKGNVLNIGRRSRIIPPHISRALASRDHNQCRFPGCDCRDFTDAHHIQHWADGGATSLANLVTLCRFHHRALHQGDFSIEPGTGADAFSFRTVCGTLIQPTQQPQFREQDRPSASILTIEPKCKDVSAESSPTETCQTKWRGESMDYEMAVSALLDKQEKWQKHAKSPPGQGNQGQSPALGQRYKTTTQN